MVLWWENKPVPDFVRKACLSPAMARIRGVDMNCGMNCTQFPLFQNIGLYSRYEHSLGVCCIAWSLTGDPAAALAGLFHDIAAPAFSHVVDFAKGDYQRQEVTEERTAEIIEKDPVIQEVLRELGLTTDRVAHDAAYPIVNSASPKLCADRLEYSLGNMVNYGFAGTEEARGYLRNAAAGTNEAGEEEILFRDRAAAAAFARRALQCGKVYSSENDRYGMEILAELLKKALQEGILAEEDLYTTEKEVIGKLLASPLSGEWEQFTEMKELEIRRDPPKEGERGWRCLHVKKRWINPLTAGGDRVYDCDPAFHRALDVFLEDDQNTYLRDVRWRERSSNE